MKKYLLLLSVFVLVSGYIFYKGYFNKPTAAADGDAPIGHTPTITIGGIVKEPNNDTVSIGKLQTSYIMYVKGDIDFDKMVLQNMENLKKVLNYPFNPKKGYLFSVGYDDRSAVQFYYQSNQEETRTVILKVVYGDKSNKVSKLYDGRYLKLVSVDDTDANRLLTYDENNEESIIEVR